MQYIGIDYSGAQTAWSPLKGLRVYRTDTHGATTEVQPPAASGWTRHDIAQWLISAIARDPACYIGIDHCLGFPAAYHQQWDVPRDWRSFVGDLQDHWPTHLPNVTVDMIRTGIVGSADQRSGNARWRRLCEQRCAAKSVFHFDVPGSVAKSSFTGLPWLLELARAHPTLHVWPFDGWMLPEHAPLLAECYPTLYRDRYPIEGRTADQHDAYSISRWLYDMHQSAQLNELLQAPIDQEVRRTADVEGWILGVQP